MVHVLHNSEQMASCIAVLDTGTCVVADSSFDLLMQKMRHFYAVRKNLRVESRGQRYQLVDFIVKVGSVVLGQTSSFKGVLVEVTFHDRFTATTATISHVYWWKVVSEFTGNWDICKKCVFVIMPGIFTLKLFANISKNWINLGTALINKTSQCQKKRKFSSFYRITCCPTLLIGCEEEKK